jgi:DNA helicase-2/ATP-dependent DNA helicase PcrA
MQEAKSRWDDAPVFGSGYTSPGWRRAQAAVSAMPPGSLRARGQVIEGEGRLVATSDPSATSSAYTKGARVFHQKFGYGVVTMVEGNKLTVAFEKAGEKKVLDSFVERT